MKKRESLTTYIPARLVEAKDRWYIVYYQRVPYTQELRRFRDTHDLNRIRNLDERRKIASEIVERINSKLPSGYPFKTADTVNITKAVLLAADIKCTSDRRNTHKSYKSVSAIFLRWAAANNLQDIFTNNFLEVEAQRFSDYLLIERKIGNTAYNNYITHLRAMWNELVKRFITEHNPWNNISKRKEGSKSRRAFSDAEKTVVFDHVFKTDRWLALGIMLQYYCAIRPAEILRLRFHHFDLNEGLIRLPGEVTKNKKSDIVTIPDVLRPWLRNIFEIERHPAHFLIFGKGVQPHPKLSCGDGTMYRKHGRILAHLHTKRLLGDITGLTYYSWKDTGALELFRQKVNILEIMRHFRHKDLSTTQRYGQSLYVVNYEIRYMADTMLPPMSNIPPMPN